MLHFLVVGRYNLLIVRGNVENRKNKKKEKRKKGKGNEKDNFF